jgi:chitodextrinase
MARSYVKLDSFYVLLLSLTVIGSSASFLYTPHANATTIVPVLPQAFVDTTYNPPTDGQTIVVNSGGNLQTAINSANPGDIIQLQAGATFTGNFRLPAKSGTAPIYIISSSYSSLPGVGARVHPSDAANMPKIVTPNLSPAFQSYFGAHDYHFIGLEITMTNISSSSLNFGLVNFAQDAGGQGTETQMSQFPYNMIFDRCYIHGTPTGDLTKGLYFNSRYSAVINSYISDIHAQGFDSQGVGGNNGPGPFDIENNYIEASTENIMFGGSPPYLAAFSPADIVVKHNYLYKQLSWNIHDPTYAGIPWAVKNNFELKNAQRVIVDGNVLENNWTHGQTGESVLFQVVDGQKAAIANVTFTHNLIKNTQRGLDMCSVCVNSSTGPVNTVLVQDNLFDNMANPSLGPPTNAGEFKLTNGGDPNLGQAGGPLNNIEIDHNTIIAPPNGPVYILGTDGNNIGQAGNANFTFTNNIGAAGGYGGGLGIISSGATPGTASLDRVTAHPYTVTQNVIVGLTDPLKNYPSGTYNPSGYAAVGFVNYNNGAGGDYHLADSSSYKNKATDGKDIGANVDAVLAATAGVITGMGTSNGPSIPTGLAVIDTTASSISLSWNAATEQNGTIAGYKIYRNGIQVGTNSNISYTDIGLQAATTYGYAVASYDTKGLTSSPSVSVTGSTTGGDSTLPTTSITSPANNATVSSTITVSANAADNVGVTKVELYSDGTLKGTDTTSPYTFSLDTIALTNGTHILTTKAYDAAGNIGISISITITVSNGTGGDSIPPSVPTNLSVINTTTSTISLSWTPSTDNVGVTGYKIYRGGAQVATTSATSYLNTGLTASTTYTYQVSAYDAAGNNSLQSVSVSGTTKSGSTGGDSIPPTTQITSPANNASASGTLTISATANDNVGVTHVDLWVDTVLRGSIVTPPYNFSLDTTSLGNGVHTLTTKAYDAAGNIGSSPSVTINVTNGQQGDSTPPSTPTGLVTTGVAASSIGLAWQPSTDNVGVTGYKVYRNGNLIGTTPNTSFTDTNLSPGTSYTYQVSAYDAAGNTSSPSASITGTTSSNGNGNGGGNGNGPQITTMISNITDTYALLTISTDQPAAVVVRYGTTNQYGSATHVSPYLTKVYEPLPDLTPNTTYHYQVIAYANDVSLPPTTSQDAIFTTAPSGTNGGGNGGGGNTTSTNAYYFANSMIYGDHSTDVLELQKFLLQYAYLTTVPTGYYGSITRHAVLLFQSTNGIATTGNVGPITRAKINQITGATPTSGRSGGSGTRILTIGMSGADVSTIQSFLINQGYLTVQNATGYFGLLTQSAVQAFQCAEQIVCSGSPDSTGYGAVGKRTRERMQ